MADLDVKPGWPGIYQFTDDDFIDGGPPNVETFEGMDNIPHLQLAQRTAFLRGLAERSDLFATYGGADNDITLTTGLDLDSVPRGLRLRFRATSSNTGAAQVSVDGLDPVSVKTVTGADMPAGYIRTDVDTHAVFDGSQWIVDRQTESGSNANGSYIRYANGLQTALISPAAVERFGRYRPSQRIVIFPIAFPGGRSRICIGITPNAYNSSDVYHVFQTQGNQTTESQTLVQYRPGFDRADADAYITITGYWY